VRSSLGVGLARSPGKLHETVHLGSLPVAVLERTGSAERLSYDFWIVAVGENTRLRVGGILALIGGWLTANTEMLSWEQMKGIGMLLVGLLAIVYDVIKRSRNTQK